jgi:hypothetical protein
MMLKHTDISNNPTVQEQLLQLKDIQAKLSDHLRDAQASYKKAADRYCLDFGSKVELKFQIGDRVWLLRHNVKTTRPCDKLDYQCLGPFMISHNINFHRTYPNKPGPSTRVATRGTHRQRREIVS